MYCPLCRAEYRDGFTCCSDCVMDLVVSLDLPEVRANPAVLLWTGKDIGEFHALVDALRDAGIPRHPLKQPGVSFGRNLLPDSQIRVLRSDFQNALEIAAKAASALPKTTQLPVSCHACGKPSRPGFTQCVHCGAVLLVEMPPRGDESTETPSSAAKLCPFCGALFGSKYTRCTQCRVDLIPARARARVLDAEDIPGELALVWRGSDPISYSRVIGILRRAGIPHMEVSTHDHLAFELGMPRPFYEVRVFGPDFPVARYLVRPIVDTLPLAPLRGGKSGDTGESPSTEVPARTPAAGRQDPRKTTILVWSGDDTSLAKNIQACFFESRIVGRLEGRSPGPLRLFVSSDQVDAARQIIREIAEAFRPPDSA